MANLLFSPSLNIISTTANNISIGLSVKNIANVDCYIDNYQLLLVGYIRSSFNIINEYKEVSNYIGPLYSLIPKLILIKANESSYEELNLSDNYQIPEGNKYSISFESEINCCRTNSPSDCLEDMLIANTTMVIGEV
jgi:hypothetical protein